VLISIHAEKTRKYKKPHLYNAEQKGDEKRLKNIGLATGITMDVLLLVLAVALTWKLAAISSNAMFFTDECFHDYIIKLSSENWHVPVFCRIYTPALLIISRRCFMY